MSVQPLYLQCIYPRNLSRVILRLPLRNLFSRSVSGIDSSPASQQQLEQHLFQKQRTPHVRPTSRLGYSLCVESAKYGFVD